MLAVSLLRGVKPKDLSILALDKGHKEQKVCAPPVPSRCAASCCSVCSIESGAVLSFSGDSCRTVLHRPSGY